jgi:transketolase
LLLGRQKLPILDWTVAGGACQGAYVLADVEKPEVILIATGSEVAVALEAQGLLADEGISARVVSMPSWELFEAQPEAYRRAVLPPVVTARVAVEAGVSFGWERYVGLRGEIIGIDRFGASAPYEVLAEEFNFTAVEVADRARSCLERVNSS